MQVGISAYLLHEGSDYRAAGLSTYIRHLLERLPRVEPRYSYVAFHGRDAPALSGVTSIFSPVPTRIPTVRILWEQLGLPLQARFSKVDVLHGTVNVLPLAMRAPTVVTLHDLSFMRHPERFPKAKALYLRAAIAQTVRSATRIMALSEHTRSDLLELFDVPLERLSVVYPGVDEKFQPLPPEEREDAHRTLFEGKPFILHVGTLEPRKNVDVLVRAFALVRRELGLPHVLALVGAKGWGYESIFSVVDELRLRDAVRFVSYVPAADLPLWYNCADLFVYPSAYEGFGLPVLEAMACGVPTITSASSALQELASDACLTVEPGSVEALVMGLKRVFEDEHLRAKMRVAGVERASRFTWNETARLTARVYEDAYQDYRS